MISRTQLRQFLAVVDTGSFTQAASSINVTQPTLSAGIAELEKRVGMKLLERTNRRVQLTPAGNQLLKHARRIEREFRAAEANGSARPVLVKPIRLGVLHSMATAQVEAALRAYRGAERVEIMEGSQADLSSAIARGKIEAAITLIDLDESRSDQSILYHEPYCLAMSVSHDLAGRDVVTAAEIANEPMIVRRSCEVLMQTSRYFTERGVRPPFSFKSTNDDRAMAMVGAGLGITVAPKSYRRPGIAMAKLDGFTATRTVGIRYSQQCIERYGQGHGLFQAFESRVSAAGSGSQEQDVLGSPRRG
ncbi:MAG: LysR family transcriptional regulator [Sphingomonadales bacterium]|nr:LysR family transcriptional regulator [Sphingomonadales bacterium]